MNWIITTLGVLTARSVKAQQSKLQTATAANSTGK